VGARRAKKLSPGLQGNYFGRDRASDRPAFLSSDCERRAWDFTAGRKIKEAALAGAVKNRTAGNGRAQLTRKKAESETGRDETKEIYRLARKGSGRDRLAQKMVEGLCGAGRKCMPAAGCCSRRGPGPERRRAFMEKVRNLHETTGMARRGPAGGKRSFLRATHKRSAYRPKKKYRQGIPFSHQRKLGRAWGVFAAAVPVYQKSGGRKRCWAFSAVEKLRRMVLGPSRDWYSRSGEEHT